jgi:tetratricopeptide (TPR) repeat protein
MIRRFLLTALLAAVIAPAAQAGSYGTELPFTAGTGARASALGLAGTSLMYGPSLQYYNPGVLARYDRKAFEFYRTTLFDSDTQYHTLSYVHPSLAYGTVGASLLRFDVGGIEERDAVNNLLGELSNSQTRFLLGYGVDLHPAVAAGLNLKVDHQSFGSYSGTGVGLDVGLHGAHTLSETAIFRDVRAGLAIINLIEPTIKLDQDDVSDPLELRLGASLVSQFGGFGFTTALDLVSPRYSPTVVRFGQEFDYEKVFALRFGVDGSTPTFGFGGSYRGIALDYAYRSEDLGDNHRLSLIVAFGGSRAQREAERDARIDAELRERVALRMADFEREQLQRLVATADSLFDGGDFEGALDQYEVVLVWAPDDARAQQRHEHCLYRVELAHGRELLDQGDYLAALYRLKQAALINPGDPLAAELVAQCQRGINDAADRTRMVDHMTRSSIDLYAEGRYVEALAGFEEVVRLDPNNQLAREYEQKSHANIQNAVQRLVLRARSRADRGEFTAAISDIEEALGFRPGDPTLTAELEELQRRRRSAIESRREAAMTGGSTRHSTPTVDTKILDAKFERGMKHFEAGRFEDAARELLEVWSVAPDFRNVTDPLSRAYLFMGMQVYSEERYDEAIRIFEKIVAIDPANLKAQRYLHKTREEASRLTGVGR